MKKIILLMLVMLLGVTGCGAKETASDDERWESSEEREDKEKRRKEEAEDAPSGKEDVEESFFKDAIKHFQDVIAEEPAIDYLDVAFEHEWYSNYDNVFLMRGEYDTMQLRTEGFAALTDAVNTFNTEYLANVQNTLTQMEQDARSEYNEYGGDYFMGPYEYETSMFLKRADKEVLSVEEMVYSYGGGAHGMTYFQTYNFDVTTGEEIALEDVIADKDRLPVILAIEILEKYPNISYWAESLEDAFQEYVTPTDAEYTPEFTWTLGYDGVTFYFSHYEIGSYVDGVQQVTVAYSEYPDIFSTKYSLGEDMNYVMEIDSTWNGTDTDLDGDGKTDYIAITGSYEADMDYYEAYTVTVNGNSYTQDSYYYDLKTYLVKSEGNNYLYVQRGVENDYKLIAVYKITPSSIEFIGEIGGELASFTNSLHFEMLKRMDMLSTYTAKTGCYVGEDGMPVEENGVYEVQYDVSIVSTVEITAELLDEEGALIGASYAFPAGTSFTLKRTDGMTYVDVLADDGQWCRFYTAPEWPPTVNGMDAESCFEMLWYAG